MESLLKHSFANNFFVWYLLLLLCLHTSSTETKIMNGNTDVLTESSELDPLTDNVKSVKGKYFWWFGPRLGRRKSSSDYDYWTVDGNSEDFAEEINRESKLTEIPLKVRSHNTISFTPRLGRATEEEIEHLYYPHPAPMLDRQRKRLLFSPRLG